jgi:hypothetical protein
MMSLHAVWVVLMVLFGLSAPALAQERDRIIQLEFKPGTQQRVVKGKIQGAQSITYTLGAEAGQRLRIALRAKGSTAFNLYAPGQKPGDAALAIGDQTDNRFDDGLHQSGIYSIVVFMNRAAARRHETSEFTLDVQLTPNSVLQKPVKNDFADGLQGGPDFWRVTAGREPLLLRAAPSRAAQIMMRFDEGAVLRNLGCRMVDGVRWCQVQWPHDAKSQGWVRGERLAESGPPAGDARVPGTMFHAMGDIPCAYERGQPLTSCRFGVVRYGAGRADVSIFPPQGEQIIIQFDHSVPAGLAAGDHGRLSFTKQKDLFLISIGGMRFEIPDAVIHGG